MGTFDGINIGSTGLNAQRRGVEIAGQNVANVNTEGYTRQRVGITPDAGPVTPAFYSKYTGSGLGVRDVEFQRLRDVYLDRRARDEMALSAHNDALNEAYISIESIFDEPSDRGFASVLGDFFSSWDDVANRPEDVAARAQLVEQGESLAIDLNSLRRSLVTFQDGVRSRLGNVVDEVNTAAERVAELQETIDSALNSGINANELLDQRDLLLTQLAEMTGGSARFESDGTTSFYVGGVALIRGQTFNPIQYQETAGVSEVIWPLDGRDVGLGGEMAGLLETINDLVPEHLGDIDDLAAQIANEVNALHTTGFDLNGAAGGDFFTIGVNGLEVSAAILADPDLVAASGVAGTLDGSVALQIAELEGSRTLYQEAIVRLGVNAQTASRRSDLQQAIVQQVQFEQEASNGVNLDEELSDMVRFQRAYEANSRFISAVDEMLNTLINGTGRVGA